MFRVSDSVSISRPPAEVFDFIAELENFPKWRANLASSTVVSERSSGLGARCDEVIQVGPGGISGTCEITTFTAGQTFTFHAVSPRLVYDGQVVVEPADAGCRLTLTGDVSPSGFLRLLQPMLKRRLQDGVSREVAAVKAQVESV